METKEITLKVQLKVKYEDLLGYVSYVFEDLEYTNRDYHYITCVKFPNWKTAPIKLDEKGYLVFKYVQEGIDKWFDGKDFHYYNNTNLIFLNFIRLPEKDNLEITLD